MKMGAKSERICRVDCVDYTHISRAFARKPPSSCTTARYSERMSQVASTGGSDGRLRWWDLQSRECVRVQEAHQGTVHALKVSPDGSTLASCGDDGAIRLWDLENGEPLQTLRYRLYERLNITGIRGLTEAQQASLCALGVRGHERRQVEHMASPKSACATTPLAEASSCPSCPPRSLLRG
jgi:hypothetical protein